MITHLQIAYYLFALRGGCVFGQITQKKLFNLCYLTVQNGLKKYIKTIFTYVELYYVKKLILESLIRTVYRSAC